MNLEYLVIDTDTKRVVYRSKDYDEAMNEWDHLDCGEGSYHVTAIPSW